MKTNSPGEAQKPMLKRSGLTDLIGQDYIFPTVSTAVQTFLECKRE